MEIYIRKMYVLLEEIRELIRELQQLFSTKDNEVKYRYIVVKNQFN